MPISAPVFGVDLGATLDLDNLLDGQRQQSSIIPIAAVVTDPAAFELVLRFTVVGTANSNRFCSVRPLWSMDGVNFDSLVNAQAVDYVNLDTVNTVWASMSFPVLGISCIIDFLNESNGNLAGSGHAFESRALKINTT